MTVINFSSLVIGVIGAVIIGYGVLIGLIEFIRIELKRFTKHDISRRRERLRHEMGSYLLLGLEFLVAADIIHTVFNPTLKELAVLGGIVAIRIAINFFLNLELRNSPQTE